MQQSGKMYPPLASPVSSEDEEDELIFSDELHERCSDTDTDPEEGSRPLPKISLKVRESYHHVYLHQSGIGDFSLPVASLLSTAAAQTTTPG